MKTINFFLLPLLWMALTGVFSPGNFLIGLLISSVILGMTAPFQDVLLIDYLRRLWQWISFFFFFNGNLIMASLRVVKDILTPRHRMRPAVLAIPLDLETDLQITILANMLTLTPGTLSLDVSPDRKVLYLHAMYVDDIDDFRREIKEKIEKRVLKVTT